MAIARWEYQHEKYFTKEKLENTGAIIAFKFKEWELEKSIQSQNKIFNHMYVSKDKDTKGRKSFDKNEFKEYRNITFLNSKHLTKWLGKLANIAGQRLAYKGQFGFTPKTGIMDILREHDSDLKTKTIMSLDMSNAFGQVPQSKVYYIFRHVMKLNDHIAKLLTKVCCYNGYLFQGNPLSPLIFNLAIFRAINRIQKSGLTIFAYADDLNIVSRDNFVSFKFMAYIKYILKEEGFKVNQKKTKFLRPKNGYSILGFTVKDKTIKASNKSKRNRVIKSLRRIQTKGIIPKWSTNVNVVEQKIAGLRNYMGDMELYHIRDNKLRKQWKQLVIT